MSLAEELKTMTPSQVQELAAAGHVGFKNFDVCDFNPHTIDRVWAEVVRTNNPPSLFRRLGHIVTPIGDGVSTNLEQIFAAQLKLRPQQQQDDESGGRFDEVNVELFREVVSRVARFYVVKKDKFRDTYARVQLIKQMMASPRCPLPAARGLIRTPSFDHNGLLIGQPGFHVPSGIFYAPHLGFVLPKLPTQPTAEDVRQAIHVWNDVVGDFPFVDDAGRAHILALAVTVLAREMISGPVPMCLVTKPATGTGSTLLLQTVGWIILGEELPESAWSSEEEEQRKFLTSALLEGRPLINLDNLTHLYSKDLLAVISGTKRGDRLLGGNEVVSIANRATFCGSGNNVSFNDEFAGRLFVVRLDARASNPRLRDCLFRHPELMNWTKENRPTLVSALLTLVQAWLCADRPAYTGKLLAGFEAWSKVVGGILQHAQVRGFLENRDLILNTAQGSEDEDLEFVAAWHALLLGREIGQVVKTKELLDKLPFRAPRPRGGGQATERSLGHYLSMSVDKVRQLDDGTEVAIRRQAADGHAKIQRWSLDVVRKSGDGHAGAAPPVQASILEADDVPF